MLRQLQLMKRVDAKSVEHAACNNLQVGNGASVIVKVEKEFVLFLFAVYGAALTDIKEKNEADVSTSLGLPIPIGDTHFPHLRFDKDVEFIGAAATRVIYFKVPAT